MASTRSLEVSDGDCEPWVDKANGWSIRTCNGYVVAALVWPIEEVSVVGLLKFPTFPPSESISHRVFISSDCLSQRDWLTQSFHLCVGRDSSLERAKLTSMELLAILPPMWVNEALWHVNLSTPVHRLTVEAAEMAQVALDVLEEGEIPPYYISTSWNASLSNPANRVKLRSGLAAFLARGEPSRCLGHVDPTSARRR